MNKFYHCHIYIFVMTESEIETIKNIVPEGFTDDFSPETSRIDFTSPNFKSTRDFIQSISTIEGCAEYIQNEMSPEKQKKRDDEMKAKKVMNYIKLEDERELVEIMKCLVGQMKQLHYLDFNSETNIGRVTFEQVSKFIEETSDPQKLKRLQFQSRKKTWLLKYEENKKEIEQWQEKIFNLNFLSSDEVENIKSSVDRIENKFKILLNKIDVCTDIPNSEDVVACFKEKFTVSGEE